MAATTSIETSKPRRIFVTSLGSLGDVFPYLAIGLRLKAMGHHVVVGTCVDYRRRVEQLGLEFRAVRPNFSWLNDPAELQWFTHRRWGMVRLARMLVSALREMYADTLAASEGADLIVGLSSVYAAGLVAEKKGIPWVSAMHIPMGIYSAHDPPLLPGFADISSRLRFRGPRFWGPLGRILNRAAGYFLGGSWRELRREIGLPRSACANPLTEFHSPALHLALFSKLIADKQPDWPPQTLVTGFPWFNPASEGLPRELERFLSDGPAPIVFTLGSAVAAGPGSFYETSVAAARLLGRRAVLIGKIPCDRRLGMLDEVAVSEYAPYGEIFPRAAAIVHHGGIGTTALGMRAGKPVLIMPYAWDQPDNAQRAQRLGISRTIDRSHYTPARAAAELRQLLENPQYALAARKIGERVLGEDGAAVACEALVHVLAAIESRTRG